MRHAFVLRVSSGEDEQAQRIAAALAALLRARSRSPVRIVTAHGEGAPAVVVGLRPEEDAPAWLPAMRVSPEPDAAASEVVSFLERWGFVAGPHAS